MSIQKPRGTYDLFGKEIKVFNYICDSLKMISNLYNCQEIKTPIFENKELFVRNIGENSDIVTKEFYDFKDKSDRELVLRPENTVGVIRSIIENKLINVNPLPLKYFYIGPMFRYERPQNGRFRQFYQFGIEYIGIKNVYEQIEIIFISKAILEFFKISHCVLKINYIGSFTTRERWINELKKYFQKYKSQLSQDSVNRLNKNPLRILDDKVDGSKNFVKKCPKVEQFFTDEEKNEFEKIKKILSSLKINYEIDQTLVRGLDYYSGFVFEYVSTSKKLTGQATLIGGGKYGDLTKELGSENYDCIGFAIGIERLTIAYLDESEYDEPDSVDIYFASLGNTKLASVLLINTLRASGYKVESSFNYEKLDKHFKYSEKFFPKLILIFGEEEAKKESIMIKNQKNKESKLVKIEDILSEIKNLLVEV